MSSIKLPEEYLLQLIINKTCSIALICTNEALPEVIVGFLYNEGVIKSLVEITALEIDVTAGEAVVLLSHDRQIAKGTVRASGFGGYQLRADSLLSFRPIVQTYSESFIKRCMPFLAARECWPCLRILGGTIPWTNCAAIA